MCLYRIYIDETGNHNMEHTGKPNKKCVMLIKERSNLEADMCVLETEIDRLVAAICFMLKRIIVQFRGIVTR